MVSALSRSRRQILRGGLSVAAAALLPRHTRAQSLAPGLELLRGAVNGLAVSTAAGSVLVDAPAPEALGDATRYADAQILFNTNWRAEHTAANEALGKAGTRIIAHENTRLWMTNDFTVQWEQRRYMPRAPEALPNETFYTNGRLELGGETIEYGYIPRAHTDGDIYVSFPRAGVMALGDLLAVDSFPIIDYSTGGWIGGFRDATARLLDLVDDSTLLVPASGAPQHADALQAQLTLCEAALDAVGQAYVNAQSLDELLAARPLALWEARLGDASLFLEQAYRSAWGHLRSMGLGVV